MTLVMYDAIDTRELPLGAPCYAGYTDGRWQTFPLLRDLFPSAHLLSIAVFASDDADCLDVEKGDATPQQAPPWVKRQLARGIYRPVVYCNASTMPTVSALLLNAAIARDRVRLWSAHYSYVPHICGPASCAYPGVPACDATQWSDLLNGGNADASVLLDNFFDGPPKPPPPPPPPPHAAPRIGDTMFTLPNGAGAVLPLPVPTAVLTVDGQIAPASSIRFASNAPASLSYMLGSSGTWIPLAIDYARSPTEVALGGALAVKVQRVDGAPNLVTGDFA